MWLLSSDNLGVKWLCHTLEETNQVIFKAGKTVVWQLEFVPIWTKPEPRPPSERAGLPEPLSR